MTPHFLKYVRDLSHCLMLPESRSRSSNTQHQDPSLSLWGILVDFATPSIDQVLSNGYCGVITLFSPLLHHHGTMRRLGTPHNLYCGIAFRGSHEDFCPRCVLFALVQLGESHCLTEMFHSLPYNQVKNSLHQNHIC